ncbi:unnamed protein product [Coregonus sp. 'balchen']|nr:unnamed protein product [Coregonus sp. 'balchen']
MASPDDLKFQEFEEATDLLLADPGASTLSMSGSSSTAPASATGDIKLDMSDDEGQEESSELLGGEKETSSFWTFEYYQSFFDVDTMQGQGVGPFWICVTLVFSVAISGNLSTFLNYLGDPQYHYRPQFHRGMVPGGYNLAPSQWFHLQVVIFLYAWLVPLGVWGFLTWRQREERQQSCYSFLETVCVYGYSLFIYIPTSVLWILPFEWLRWLLILVAMVISGSFLVLTFWPVVRDDTKVTAFTTVATIVVLHALLAIGCKMYFFQTATRTVTPTVPTPNHTAAILNTKTY